MTISKYAEGLDDFSAFLQNELDKMRFGGEYVLPRGRFLLNSSINIPRGVKLRGETSYSTVLICGRPDGDLVYMHTDSQIEHLKITCATQRLAGAYVKIVGNAAQISNFVMERYAVGVWIKGAHDKPLTFPVVSNGNFFNPSVEGFGGMIVCENYANAVITRVIGSSASSATAQPGFGIRLLNGDTCLISDVDIIQHKNAILIDPPQGYNVYATSVSNSLFDSSSGHSSTRVSACNGGGTFSTKFANCWFGISSHHGLEIEGGPGQVSGLSLVGSEFIANKKHGCYVRGPNVENIVISGGISTGNGGDGIHVSGAKNFILSGFLITASSDRPANQGFGLNVDGCTDFVLSGCLIKGNKLGELNGQVH